MVVLSLISKQVRLESTATDQEDSDSLMSTTLSVNKTASLAFSKYQYCGVPQILSTSITQPLSDSLGVNTTIPPTNIHWI